MMKTEVTYSLYQQVSAWGNDHGYLINDGCNGAQDENCRTPESDGGQHPVTSIEWLDTIVFANALSEMLQLEPVYLMKNTEPLRAGDRKSAIYINPKATGYRLPGLSEWQIAARGGKPALKSNTYGDLHSGSDNAKKVAWYPEFDSPHYGTQIVGKLSPNALGIFDMSGNVSEWIYESYQLDNTIMYYFCGGSYLSHATTLASCDSHSSGIALSDIGFRLVRSSVREKSSLVIVLSLLVSFTVYSKESSRVTLKDGINMLDINGDGVNDLVVYSKFENNTSHPNHTMTIFVIDRQKKYHILPVANDTGFTWSDFILSASTIKIADYALYKKQKGYFIVSAHKLRGRNGDDDMSDNLPVKFTRYDMNTAQDAPGVPHYSWVYHSAYITGEKYPDIDEAFKHFQAEKLK